ncbi:MAG: hypothetical protein DME26_03350 [Verrucomicrobia bacterium]|nr:MAG: hypothetical protein DME26_03350 [Verrucomicrobiota bacterium]
MLDDQQLLRRYAADGSETAFGELVARYVNLVYSTAFRRTSGDELLAQDVAQLVFTDLARKARLLPKNVVLAGWLHKATRYATAQMLRSERRRQAREQEAVAMNALTSESTSGWEQIHPLLDEALDQLGHADRDALLLRFFEQRSLAEIGHALGSSEEAARKRVSRALEKLRAFLIRRGVTTTAVALSTAISANAVQVSPAGFAAALASASLAGAAAGTGTALTLVKFMAVTKLQAGIVSAVLVASVVAPLVLQNQVHARLGEQEQALRQRAEHLRQLHAENERLSRLLVSAKISQSLPNDQFNELLRLRGQVGSLGKEVKELTRLTAVVSTSGSNVIAAMEQLWSGRVNQLKQWLEGNPSEKIPELQFLSKRDWLDGIYPHTLQTEESYRSAMSIMRANAQAFFQVAS